MSQEIAGEIQETLKPASQPSAAPLAEVQPQPMFERIVEVTHEKKKVNVIQIQDSEEEQAKKVKISKPKERKLPSNSPKIKKMTLRCMLCKEPGKKASMKACIDCKGFSHIACLEQEGEQTIRHLCRKCRHKRQEGLAIRRGEKGGEQKTTAKRLQKEKKREEYLKKMGQFQERYPYYFQDEKVRFPIEDKLLFIYKDLFDITETPRPRPTQHPLIPSSMLADFLLIENFFSTFKEELIAFGKVPSDINKNIFFVSMSSKGFDGVFCCLLECLLNVYLSDIFQKNKTDNVRLLNDHPFFTLMNHMHQNQELSQEVLVRSAKEIMRYLATIPSMKKAFENLQYPDQIEMNSKINLAVGLIKGLSEVDEFHDLVSIKSEKMQLLTKERTDLVAQLKIDEAQNLSNNEVLKDMTQAGRKMEESQQGVTRLLTKQLDKHKKKMIRLVCQQNKSQETIKEIRKKIAQIGRTMPFLTSQMLFLGKDRNDSQFFFYVRQPNKIYVKFRSYLLDKNQLFYIYQSKETIFELLKSLNTKGLKERHLAENIQSLIKDEIITNQLSLEDHGNFMLEENRFRSITFEDILNIVKQTEDTFTTYLTVKQYQWAAPNIRQLFMQQLMNITDLQILKENIKSLQENFLFAEYGSAQAPRKREEDSEDEMREEVRQGRKKIPIRIWGINSEKTKKYWVQYLQESIDVIGVWLCAYLFKITVDKYVKKKMEAYYQQQAKDRKLKSRENGTRGRPPLSRKSSDKVEKRNRNNSISESQSQVVECRRPNLRERKPKKMNIESDLENDLEYQEGVDSSDNQDCCQICGEYGEMICCDTCPKVYHSECLKMKDIPQGDWSCFKCLQKMSNERQTRSRAKKMSKFL